jgi:hypothetical protein
MTAVNLDDNGRTLAYSDAHPHRVAGLDDVTG